MDNRYKAVSKSLAATMKKVEAKQAKIAQLSKEIAKLNADAIKAKAQLKNGDVVELDGKRYTIVGQPSIIISPVSGVLDEVIWDIAYDGLMLKPNGEPYYKSQSGLRLRDIHQMYLYKGVAKQITTP